MRPLPTLPDDQLVWVNTRGSQTPGRVIEQARSPRSYIVETTSGRVRRNRHHLQSLLHMIPVTVTQKKHLMLFKPVQGLGHK